jgi:hypothetical protein
MADLKPFPIHNINIFGATYRIQPFHYTEESDHQACVDFHNRLIQIRSDVDSTMFWSYLGHEVVHVWLAWSGISSLIAMLDSHFDKLGHHVEECICDSIGPLVFRLYQDNPGLYFHLCKGGKGE